MVRRSGESGGGGAMDVLRVRQQGHNVTPLELLGQAAMMATNIARSSPISSSPRGVRLTRPDAQHCHQNVALCEHICPASDMWCCMDRMQRVTQNNTCAHAYTNVHPRAALPPHRRAITPTLSKKNIFNRACVGEARIACTNAERTPRPPQGRGIDSYRPRTWGATLEYTCRRSIGRPGWTRSPRRGPAAISAQVGPAALEFQRDLVLPAPGSR